MRDLRQNIQNESEMPVMLEQYVKNRLAHKDILLMTHIVIGYPSFEDSFRIVAAMVEGGVREQADSLAGKAKGSLKKTVLIDDFASAKSSRIYTSCRLQYRYPQQKYL